MAVLGQVQGFDTEAVATEQHPTAVSFRDGEREHPVEVADEVVAPAVVGLEQNLCVAVREEPVALVRELAP